MSTSSSSLSSFPRLSADLQSQSNLSTTSASHPPLNQIKQSPYQVAQQVKFMHLEAEIESLLQQLKNLKQQRTAATSGSSPTH